MHPLTPSKFKNSPAEMRPLTPSILTSNTDHTPSNYNYNKYVWGRKGCPNGECGGGKDTEDWDFSKFFSNACDNIADGYEKSKNALLGIKERAENSGKIRAALQQESGGAGDSTESFSTIVNPTQPDGHENFHSLF